MKLGSVIAVRELAVGRSTTRHVTVQIGKPRRGDLNVWWCPYRVIGVGDDSVRAAGGVDAVQALQLAELAIAARLDTQPRLRWLGRDHGFARADRWVGEEWQRAISFAWDGRRRSPVPGPWPLELYPASQRATRLLLLTKPYLARVWIRTRLFPPRTDAFVSYGVPSRRVFDVVRGHAKRLGAIVQFVGDLDPLDLAAYVALGAGGAPVGKRRRAALAVRYSGVDDRWLSACERNSRHLPLASFTIELSRGERDQLAALELAGLDLDATVGPRSAAILRAGYKLEIEGATNPAIFRPRHQADVRKLVLGGN